MNTKDKLKLMDEIKTNNDRYVEAWKMENKMLKGLLVTPYTSMVGAAEILTIPNTLDGLTNALECEYIETTISEIGGREFMVVCDEEGRLKDESNISAIFVKGGKVVEDFVGNIFIVSANTDDGEMIGLSDEDIDFIGKHSIMYTGMVIVLG